MIFVIGEKKYNTENMEKVASVKKWYSLNSWMLDAMFGAKDLGRVYNCELWRSEKGNWLITHEKDYNEVVGQAIEEAEAKELLQKYDLKAYENLFGEIEEA